MTPSLSQVRPSQYGYDSQRRRAHHGSGGDVRPRVLLPDGQSRAQEDEQGEPRPRGEADSCEYVCGDASHEANVGAVAGGVQ